MSRRIHIFNVSYCITGNKRREDSVKMEKSRPNYVTIRFQMTANAYHDKTELNSESRVTFLSTSHRHRECTDYQKCQEVVGQQQKTLWPDASPMSSVRPSSVCRP